MAPVIRPLMSVPVRPPQPRQLPPPDDDIRVSGDAAEPEPEESQSSKPIVGIIILHRKCATLLIKQLDLLEEMVLNSKPGFGKMRSIILSLIS